MVRPLYMPKKIGNVEIRNRIVMGPAGFGFCDKTEGYINADMIEFFRQRAKGGIGLIDVGAIQVDPNHFTNYDMIKIYDDSYIPGFKKLTDAVHAEGAKIMGQLLHQGRYCPSHEYFGKQAPAPSAVFTTYTKETPREMTTEECEEMVQHFGRAAKRCVEAGFDIVEIGTNSGYLIGQFLSPVSNMRTDKYGGPTLEDRMTFLLETVACVRENIGPDVPISVRIGGSDLVKGSNTNEEAVKIAVALEKAGVDVINVTGGWHEASMPQTTMDMPHGAFFLFGKKIKDAVSIPVIQSNRMNVEVGERLVYEGAVDFISMARPMIADPELPNKAMEGRYDEIRPCVGCNQGCLDNILKHHPVCCLVNAEAGREFELMVDGKLPGEVKSAAPEKILVLGGGPAGMEFARVAANRGHAVTLWERKDHLGGQFEVNSAPPGRHDFMKFCKYLVAEMSRLGVNVVLNKEASAEEVEAAVAAGTFDRVVVATGANPIAPPLPVEEGAYVVQSWDVLLKKVEIGKNIVVVGGGATGVETAEYLGEMGTIDAETFKFLLTNGADTLDNLQKAMYHGSKNVTIVEMQKKLGRDLGATTRFGLLNRVKKLGVKSMTETKVTSITKEGVHVEGLDGTKGFIPADTVVLAIGSRSNNAIYDALEGKVEKLMKIGDATKPAFVLDAVKAAYEAAYNL